MRLKSTSDVVIPKDPFLHIVGQEEAIRIAGIASRQKRNLLLVAPPGTGKSMLAQAVAFHVSKPSEEISVLHNPESPERPLIEVKREEDVVREKKLASQLQGKLVGPTDVPAFVAERLGFRCRRCGKNGKSTEKLCTSCGSNKALLNPNVFGSQGLVEGMYSERFPSRVHTTRLLDDGREEVIFYERKGELIRVLDERTLEKLDELKKKKPRKILLSANRKNFVPFTGSSETELLGDVRHDPYGGHQSIGTPPYLRVVPGAIHEAHEGVLFVDELSALGYVQRFLLTAMQEKKFPITGHNPQSSGASVRVDNVPCDFILVSASNINELPNIMAPLRSRIIGNGYEVLLNTTMPDNESNRLKLTQFVAQEILKDGKIPHASIEAVECFIAEASRRARDLDEAENSLTLRLRELSGLIRLSGDLAKLEGSELIEPENVRQAVKNGKNIEEQLRDRYGSVWNAGYKEFSPLNNSKRAFSDAKEVT